MNRVDGKVAIVTGGGSGIGRASCELMAKAGAQVVVADIDISSAEETVKNIVDAGGEAVAIALDAASESDWEKVITFTLEHFKKLDVLVNNAGIAVQGSIKDTSLDDWEKVIAVNMSGTFLGTRDAINAMIDNPKGGAIINISSIAGLIEEKSPVSYAASKGGVRMFSKAAAAECKREGHNIRVNSIYPGGIDTPAASKGASEEVIAWIRKTVKEGNMGEPIDIARGVLFLASDDSSYVTGSELVIDGGVTTTIFNTWRPDV